MLTQEIEQVCAANAAEIFDIMITTSGTMRQAISDYFDCTMGITLSIKQSRAAAQYVINIQNKD